MRLFSLLCDRGIVVYVCASFQHSEPSVIQPSLSNIISPWKAAKFSPFVGRVFWMFYVDLSPPGLHCDSGTSILGGVRSFEFLGMPLPRADGMLMIKDA